MNTNQLSKALLQEGFCDLRYQNYQNTSLKATGSKIETASVVKKSGGNVRVLTGGGFGTFCFTDLSDIDFAVREAKLASDLIPGKKTLKIEKINQAQVLVSVQMDPRNLLMDEKKALMQHYIDLILSYPEIVHLESEYYEQFTDTLILNNQGTQVRTEELICGMNFRITGKKADVTQVTRLSFGGGESYDALRNQEEAVIEKVKQTLALLKAPPVVGGLYDVVLDSDVSGLFIHEAFGHLSESDSLIGNDVLQETMTLGKPFAPPYFNVIDDPTLEGLPGSYLYDHEGTQAKRTFLIKEGRLAGRLHSLESASLLNEAPTGHARAKHFGFMPIVRMGNIYIDKGEHRLEDMIKSIQNGFYLFGSAGGQTNGDTYTFAVQGAYEIKNGQLGGLVRDLALSGDLKTTLQNIEMVGDQVAFSKSGGCGKNGQILIKSGKGSAPIKVRAMAIGGR